MPSLSVENYVKAIYLLASRDGENGVVGTGESRAGLGGSRPARPRACSKCWPNPTS